VNFAHAFKSVCLGFAPAISGTSSVVLGDEDDDVDTPSLLLKLDIYVFSVVCIYDPNYSDKPLSK